jgi:hypothetical protein
LALLRLRDAFLDSLRFTQPGGHLLLLFFGALLFLRLAFLFGFRLLAIFL